MERLLRVAIFIVVGLTSASQLHAATLHSADLGWKKGEDITAKFKSFLSTQGVKAGNELVLDHTYRISGTYTLPDGFTLLAKKGAGFEVTDAKTNGKPLLELGNKTTLRNLTIVYLNTPELGGRSYRHGVDFFDKKGISVSGKSDILIENCRLEGMIASHIGLNNCNKLKVIGCHIIGGFWAVSITGSEGLVFRNCLFEKSCCDGIKTLPSSQVVRKILVESCVFQDNCRDGIDTTGGFNDAVIQNCIFRRLGTSGMDIKSTYKRKGRGFLGGPKNIGILIEKSLFSDMPNAFVFTTINKTIGKTSRTRVKSLLTVANFTKYAVHDIDINDCVFGHVEKPLQPSLIGRDSDTYGYGVRYPRGGEHMRMFFLKDAYDIRYKDARTFGDRITPSRVRSINPKIAGALDSKAKVTGNILKKRATPPKPGDTTVSFPCGPQPLEVSEDQADKK